MYSQQANNIATCQLTLADMLYALYPFCMQARAARRHAQANAAADARTLLRKESEWISRQPKVRIAMLLHACQLMCCAIAGWHWLTMLSTVGGQSTGGRLAYSIRQATNAASQFLFCQSSVMRRLPFVQCPLHLSVLVCSMFMLSGQQDPQQACSTKA
jgi:hypothetical protein